MIFNATSGSNPLNFKVVAGATEPSNPKVNTIWVKTSETVVSWKLAKQSSIPTFTAVKGRLLISYSSIDSVTTTNANFDALKITSSQPNSIMVGLNAAYLNTNGTASGWAKVNAYIYKSSGWVQFSAEFAATIKVTYPSGSTLTCTNGSTTLTATTTTGSYTFTVPNTGTWTVKAVSGSNTASESVSITTDGQSASVTLTFFDGYLFNYEDKNTDITGTFEKGSATTVSSLSNGGVKVTSGSMTNNVYYKNKAIDLSKWSTLKVYGKFKNNTANSTTYDRVGLALYSATPTNYNTNREAYVKSSHPDPTTATLSLDVSNFENSYYVGLYVADNQSYIELYKLWLE